MDGDYFLDCFSICFNFLLGVFVGFFCFYWLVFAGFG